jgi:hypothetical protein
VNPIGGLNIQNIRMNTNSFSAYEICYKVPRIWLPVALNITAMPKLYHRVNDITVSVLVECMDISVSS